MTAADVRLVSQFGARIAQCIGQMASIALALAVHCNDEVFKAHALEAIKTVTNDMQAILDQFHGTPLTGHDA